MDFSDEIMRSFQEAADRGRARYENRMKAERSVKRAAFEKKRKELGIKVIRGGKTPSRNEGGR